MHGSSKVHVWLLLAALAPACGPTSGEEPRDAEVDTDATAMADGNVPSDGPPIFDSEVEDAYVPECGNGVEDPGEACDDGNHTNGDGCNATCTLRDDVDLVAPSFVAGDQRAPHLAVTPSGVAMVWEDHGGADGDGLGVRLRLFGDDGAPQEIPAIGADLDVPANTTVTGDQGQPAIAVHTDGRMVVVWTDWSGTAGAEADVRAQMFEADGSRISNPQTGAQDFVVHTTSSGVQRDPVVGINSSGVIFIAWTDGSATGADTSGAAIRGRIFDFNGNPQTNPEAGNTDDFVINMSTTGNQVRPALTPTGPTGWGVVWVDDTNLDGDGAGIVGTLLGVYGSHLLTADALLNTTTAGNQDHPAIALQPGTGVVVAWTDDSRGSDDPIFRSIRARALALDGAPRTNGVTMDTMDFPVNTLTDGSQQRPTIAVDPGDGSVLIAWQDGSASDGSWAGIRGRLFSLSLSPVPNALAQDGGDFQVNRVVTGAQLAPAACHVGGQFLAAWEDESGATPDPFGSTIRYRFLPPF